MVKVKTAYIRFIQEKHVSFFERLAWALLYALSLLYKTTITIRNFLYDRAFLRITHCKKPVISIGNLSWGGSGKTSLVSFLHTALESQYRVASITKGYAKDEYLLLKNKLHNVYDARNRVALLKKISDKFDVFILDDGFQYRKLARDIDIVTLGPRDCLKNELLPAYILREPFESIKRAHIAILNYYELIPEVQRVVKRLHALNPQLEVYTASYQAQALRSVRGELKAREYFNGKKIAVLSAIGYPQGFLSTLEQSGIPIAKEVFFPDHYECSKDTISQIEKELTSCGIEDIVITHKDYYHLDLSAASLNYFVLEVQLVINEQKEFLEYVRSIIKNRRI